MHPGIFRKNLKSKVFDGRVISRVYCSMGGSLGGRKCCRNCSLSTIKKSTSNSGWADTNTPWPRVMQALSHFLYHASSGQFFLCDLQGEVYSNAVILTDPVILSRNKMYGVTDLGLEGISSFFSNHVCNEFCKDSWSKPAD